MPSVPYGRWTAVEYPAPRDASSPRCARPLHASLARRPRAPRAPPVGVLAGRAEPEETNVPSTGAGGSISRDASGGVSPDGAPVALAQWSDCGNGFQCADIRVPKDYATSAGT